MSLIYLLLDYFFSFKGDNVYLESSEIIFFHFAGENFYFSFMN